MAGPANPNNPWGLLLGGVAVIGSRFVWPMPGPLAWVLSAVGACLMLSSIPVFVRQRRLAERDPLAAFNDRYYDAQFNIHLRNGGSARDFVPEVPRKWRRRIEAAGQKVPGRESQESG